MVGLIAGARPGWRPRVAHVVEARVRAWWPWEEGKELAAWASPGWCVEGPSEQEDEEEGGGQPSARGAECGLLYDRRDAVCQRGGGRLLAVVEGSVPGSLPFALSPLRVRSNLRSALAPEAHGHGRDSPPEPRHALRKRSRPTLLASMSALALTWTHTALWRTRGYSTTMYDSLHTSAVRTSLPATAFSVQRATYDGIHLSRASVARRPCDCITFAAGMGTLRAKVEQVGPAQSEPNLDPH